MSTKSLQEGAAHVDNLEEEPPKQPWWAPIKEPGSAFQIVTAAIISIAIGLAVTFTVDEVPEAAVVLVKIPGTLWLRALKAVVLPLIVTSMILAVQKLREMERGGGILARWTIGYYVLTTILAILHSVITVSLGWRRLMTMADEQSLEVDPDKQDPDIEKNKDLKIHEAVEDMFESLIPENVVNALATDSLLAVLITAIIVGYLIQGPNSALLKVTLEIEKLIMKVITFLIKCAPIGVFFLIMPNFFKLDVKAVGQNLGVLMGAALVSMFFHLFVITPGLYFFFVRKNPYSYWVKCAPAWITAWGTASSAATLTMSLKCAKERGLPLTVYKFCLPLGALINMDGTAIYFPVVVVFLAQTQGITLQPTDYVMIVLLATLSSIGTTPIPSSSLVLTVMIAGAVNVPVTGMFAVVVAIDWLIDRFRTATNVSGDLYASAVISKVTGIKDPEDVEVDLAEDLPKRGSTQV